MAVPASKTPAKLSVDFSGVEIRRGGSSIHIPEGDYLLRAIGCERKPKKDDPSRFYLNWKCEVAEGTHKGKGPIYHITTLDPEKLWGLRTFLVDLLGGEEKVPQKAVDIPLAKIVAAKPRFGATLVDDEYDGKVKSKIAATFSYTDWKTMSATAEPESEDEDEDGEEEVRVPTKSSKAKAAAAAATESEENEDMEEIDVDDL